MTDIKLKLLTGVISVLLLTGCIGGIPDSASTANGDAGDRCRDRGNPYAYHGLLGVSETTTNATPIVPVSNETVQSTEPIVEIVEQYRQTGTAQQMGVDCRRFNATDRALETIGNGYAGYVRLDDGTVVVVSLATNDTV